MKTTFFIYTVKDCVTGVMSDLRLFVNQAQALRWFDGFCQESKIAGDLQLFCLGSYNCETGEIFSKVEFEKNGGNC